MWQYDFCLNGDFYHKGHKAKNTKITKYNFVFLVPTFESFVVNFLNFKIKNSR